MFESLLVCFSLTLTICDFLIVNTKDFPSAESGCVIRPEASGEGGDSFTAAFPLRDSAFLGAAGLLHPAALVSDSLQRCQAACCTIHATCLTGVSLSGRRSAVYVSQPTKSESDSLMSSVSAQKLSGNLFSSLLMKHSHIIQCVYEPEGNISLYYIESVCLLLDIFAFIRQ